MDMDIDMDIDIDLGVDDHMDETVNQNTHAPEQSSIIIPNDPIAREGGEPILDKLHIRGLDNLSSAEVKQYAGEHYPLDHFERIEWIDDTSANLIYSTAHAASEALLALTDDARIGTDVSSVSSLQLRPARKSSAKPDVELFIRQGSTIDTKKKGAHDASRYYLMNPEQDPRQRRPYDNRRPRGRRGSDGDGEYNRRQYDDREHRRRRQEPGNSFEASMYDDDTDRPRDTQSSRKRQRNNDEDLFSNKFGRSSGRLRGRSASPLGEGDGRMGFGTDADDTTRYKRARQRSRSPNRPVFARNAGKELFPATSSNQSAPKELFPSKQSSSGMRSDDPPQSPGVRASLELFPNKRGSFSNHRRTGAFDASHQKFFAESTPPRERSLADRITGRPATAPADENLRVRGAAENGISVRGAANGNNQSSDRVRELFPMKAGNNNVGKELFGERIRGRAGGGSRRKAEDMFS